jgi:hypothetical protein
VLIPMDILELCKCAFIECVTRMADRLCSRSFLNIYLNKFNLVFLILK